MSHARFPVRTAARRLATTLAALALVAGFAVANPLAAPAPVAAATGNLVFNGTFASGASGWQWHPLSGVENCCAAPPNGYPNAFAHPNGGGDYIVPWQNIPNPPAGAVIHVALAASNAPTTAWGWVRSRQATSSFATRLARRSHSPACAGSARLSRA